MSTLCWDCARACGDCSWSNHHQHKPVPGWKAEEVHRNYYDRAESLTYNILECPEFVRDAWQGGLSRTRPLTAEERAARRREQARISSANKYRRIKAERTTPHDIPTD